MPNLHPTTVVALSEGLDDVSVGTDDEGRYTLVLTYADQSFRRQARQNFLRGLVEGLTDAELDRLVPGRSGLKPWVVEAVVNEQLDREARARRVALEEPTACSTCGARWPRKVLDNFGRCAICGLDNREVPS